MCVFRFVLRVKRLGQLSAVLQEDVKTHITSPVLWRKVHTDLIIHACIHAHCYFELCNKVYAHVCSCSAAYVTY